MSKEYEGIKKITAAAIYDAGDKNSDCFQREFQKFLHWAHKHFVEGRGQSQFFFFLSIGLHAIKEELKDRPEWEKFLIEEGFIEVVPKTCRIGDKFKHDDGESYMLALVALSGVLLVRTSGRGFYGYPSTDVKDADKITNEEFRQITKDCPEYFTKVGEEEL